MKTAISVVRGLPVEVEVEPILAGGPGRSRADATARASCSGRSPPVRRPGAPREVAQATCRLAWSHEAPNADCSCGLHATP